MTLVAIGNGLMYPSPYSFPHASSATPTLDAATEKYAMVGRIYIDGRPGSAKTLSTGTIQYRTGAVTFANGGTTVDIGIQDVASGAGPIAQPDGTFDVKTTLTGGGGGITTTAWNTATMNSGTKNITHGDLIAVVWDMTARAGADSVTITNGSIGWGTGVGSSGLPTTNAFVSSAWQTTNTAGAARSPNVIIVFDDGTLGWLDATIPFTTVGADTFQDSTNPDERGMIFQVPWSCKVDALWVLGGVTDASSDFTLKLYSDPTGSPSSLASVAVAAENLGVAALNEFVTAPLATEVSLSANTDYIVTMLATGTSNSRLHNIVLGNTAHRAALNGGTTLAKATRNNSSGAFTAESPAVTMYGIGVRISQFDDGTGSGSGGGSRSRGFSGFA